MPLSRQGNPLQLRGIAPLKLIHNTVTPHEGIIGMVQSLRTKLLPQKKVSAPSLVQAQVAGLRAVSKNNAAERARQAEGARNDIDHLLKSISQNDADIDAAWERNQRAYKEIERLLRAHNLLTHTDGAYIAQILENFTRQSRTIDPKKFKAKVGDDTFWKVVEVPIGKAEGLLTDKELAGVVDVVPGKSTGFVFSVKPVGRRARR